MGAGGQSLGSETSAADREEESETRQCCVGPEAASAPSALQAEPSAVAQEEIPAGAQAEPPSAVQVLSASGEVVATGTSLDAVEHLRSRAAAHLGVTAGMVRLLRGGKELLDGEPLNGEPGAEILSLMLIRLPCEARVEEYESFIAPCDSHAVQNVQNEEAMTEDARWAAFVRRYRSRGEKDEMALVRLGLVEFPEPQDININMMPFVIEDQNSIPEEYRHYWPMIKECKCLQRQRGRIGYLTIQESRVSEAEAQRRPGLHVESTCVLAHGGATGVCHPWGLGESVDGYILVDGIYMASTVAGSTRVWDAKLRNPEKIVGSLGDVEHLRHLLGEGNLMGASELFWMTDTTPHESVPLAAGTYRQYFRVVCSSVSVWYEKHSVWYEKHSTKNRLGIVPERILSEDKFDGTSHTKLSYRKSDLPPMIMPRSK